MDRWTKLMALIFGAFLAAAGCSSSGSIGDGDSAGDLGGAGDAAGDTGTAAPSFPGAGTSDDSAPLGGGSGAMDCYFPASGGSVPAATMEYAMEVIGGADVLHARLTLNPDFVDNSYGINSINWGNRGHTYKDLDRSDHAELLFSEAGGSVVLDFLVDFISLDPTSPSGYGSLGVSGGDGKMVTGSEALVVDTRTSLDRNVNERGYLSYFVDSPATDLSYTPNPAAPEWDYRVVYEAWVDSAAFGSAGFGDVFIDHIHASPSKDAEDTMEVVKGACPPDWGCYDPDGCGEFTNSGDDGSSTGDETPPGDDGSGDCADGSCEEGTLCTDSSECGVGKECVEGVCQPVIY